MASLWKHSSDESKKKKDWQKRRAQQVHDELQPIELRSTHPSKATAMMKTHGEEAPEGKRPAVEHEHGRFNAQEKTVCL